MKEDNERKRLIALRKAKKQEEKRAREKIQQKLEEDKDDDTRVKTAFNPLLTFVKNVATNPNEEKFWKIRLSNATFQARVGSLKGGIEFLELCGFGKIEGGEFLFLPRESVDREVLNSVGPELKNATNPFFGVL